MSTIYKNIDCTDFEEINQINYKRIKNKAIKAGYSEGVNDGRESIFQQGFDQGYKDAFATAFNLEKYRVFFEKLNLDKVNNANLVLEKDKFSKLQLKELKSLKIEGNSLNLDSQRYVKKSLEKCTQDMPIATGLLNV